MWKTKFGRCIYTSPSGYKVYQNLIYRWLTFGSSALQTVINRRFPHIPVLHYLPALTLMLRVYPGDCCLLGLGGAGVVHMLGSNYSITAVDSSKEVIDIARNFFMLDELEQLKVVHDNALNYLQYSDKKYAHLLVDLYDAEHFPIDCANESFFAACKLSLLPGGYASFNLANLKEQKPILELIKKQFEATLIIPIRKSANIVIIVGDCSVGELITKVEECSEVDKISWIESWGYVVKVL